MNANLIHKWLRDPRFVADCAEGNVAAEATTFLPVEIEGMALSPSTPDLPLAAPAVGAPLCAHRVDITLSDGRRILVEGTTALSAVLGLVKGLTT